MHPKATRQQDAQHPISQETQPMRNHTGPWRSQTQAPMTTVYQESFRPPSCYTLIASTSREEGPLHALKGTSAGIRTIKMSYMTQKWRNPLPKVPQQPSVPPKDHRRLKSCLHSPVDSLANEMPPETDYTTMYQNDFRPWKPRRQQLLKPKDCLKVNQGLVVPKYNARDEQRFTGVDSNSVPLEKETKPIESITSYVQPQRHAVNCGSCGFESSTGNKRTQDGLVQLCERWRDLA